MASKGNFWSHFIGSGRQDVDDRLDVPGGGLRAKCQILKAAIGFPRVMQRGEDTEASDVHVRQILPAEERGEPVVRRMVRESSASVTAATSAE